MSVRGENNIRQRSIHTWWVKEDELRPDCVLLLSSPVLNAQPIFLCAYMAIKSFWGVSLQLMCQDERNYAALLSFKSLKFLS